MSKIGVTSRRKPVWADKNDDISCCPDCQSDLVGESNPFLVDGYAGGRSEVFLVSHQGQFCKKCPVVVLNKTMFDFSLFAGNSGIEDYNVVGIVDIDAIPEDERDLPVGDGKTPLKLMEFIKGMPKISTKISRNALCPCNSGKKYKRCCALATA